MMDEEQQQKGNNEMKTNNVLIPSNFMANAARMRMKTGVRENGLCFISVCNWWRASLPRSIFTLYWVLSGELKRELRLDLFFSLFKTKRKQTENIWNGMRSTCET